MKRIAEAIRRKKMSEGGTIKPQNTERPDKGYGAIIQKANGGLIEEPKGKLSKILGKIRMRHMGR